MKEGRRGNAEEENVGYILDRVERSLGAFGCEGKQLKDIPCLNKLCYGGPFIEANNGKNHFRTRTRAQF